MNKKKKQHFVPQLLLRNFSKDKTYIDMFYLKEEKLIHGVKLQDQCFKNYYYGRDGKIEDALAGMEGPSSRLFKKIITSDGQFNLSLEDIELIKFFTLIQAFRTEQPAEDLNFIHDQLAKKILQKDPITKKFNLEDYRVGYEMPQLNNLVYAALLFPILNDLALKVIINNTNADFIFSDHPVVFYNKWAIYHPKFKMYPNPSTGLGSKGLILVIPISPKRAIVLYDSSTYKVGFKKQNFISLKEPKNVFEINILQSINAFNCFYFLNHENLGMNLGQFYKKWDLVQDNFKPTIFETKPKMETDGRMSSLIITTFRNIKTKLGLNFIRIIDKNPYKEYRGAIIPFRSKDVIKKAEESKIFF